MMTLSWAFPGEVYLGLYILNTVFFRFFLWYKTVGFTGDLSFFKISEAIVKHIVRLIGGCIHKNYTDLLIKNCWLIVSITKVTIFKNFGNLLENY